MQLQGSSCNFGTYAIFRLPICCSLWWRLTVILLQSVFEPDGRMTEWIAWMRYMILYASQLFTLVMVISIPEKLFRSSSEIRNWVVLNPGLFLSFPSTFKCLFWVIHCVLNVRLLGCFSRNDGLVISCRILYLRWD